jgi:hypothetical protein
MTQLSIQDGIIQLVNSAISNTSGEFTHTGDYKINGTLTVDTLNVTNFDAPQRATAGHWAEANENDLNSKGFIWEYPGKAFQLNFRTGGRLWTNASIDLSPTSTFKIDNNDVLSASALGSTIVRSNLRELGTLKSLHVGGDSNLGDFAFFNESANRLGLGTEDPSAALTIADNNVEINIGSPRADLGQMGTRTSHDLGITTDDIVRIMVKNNGEVHIGNEDAKNGVLKVFGSIYAENIVTDTRLERTSPLEFKATKDTSVYGKGLVWTGDEKTKKFVMLAGPDRLASTENISVANGCAYYVGTTPVLYENALGIDVLHSNLISVGTLEKLTVGGEARFLDNIDATSLSFKDNRNTLSFAGTTITANNEISLDVCGVNTVYADSHEITIGSRENNRRPVKVFGLLSVGTNQPVDDPDLGLLVKGNVSFANKKFVTGTSAPYMGRFAKGDICWNQNPTPDNYVGWVCIEEGAPGSWLPFGAIGRQ